MGQDELENNGPRWESVRAQRKFPVEELGSSSPRKRMRSGGVKNHMKRTGNCQAILEMTTKESNSN